MASDSAAARLTSKRGRAKECQHLRQHMPKETLQQGTGQSAHDVIIIEIVVDMAASVQVDRLHVEVGLLRLPAIHPSSEALEVLLCSCSCS